MRYNWRMTSSLRAWRPLTAALLITFICLGRFLEAAAKGKTSKVTAPSIPRN